MTKKQTPYVVVSAVWVNCGTPELPHLTEPRHLRAELVQARSSGHASIKWSDPDSTRRVWYAISADLSFLGRTGADWIIPVYACLVKHGIKPNIGFDLEVL